MLCYVIILNIHKGTGYNFHVAWLLYFDLDCWLLLPWRGTQPTILQLFPRYSVDIYKCTNASELISLSRRVHVGCKNLWTTPVVSQARLSLPVWESGPRDYTWVHVHIAIATQVIQLLHSQQIVEVWLVTDENALASNRPHKLCMTMLMMSKW